MHTKEIYETEKFVKTTKKRFRELCSFHEYGRGKRKRNAIYFDWKENEKGRGFKYMVKASIENSTKRELFEILYKWVIDEEPVPWWVEYRYAKTDADRFRVSIGG